MCFPRPQAAHLPGQRAPYTTPGAEARSRTAPDAFPRYETYLRHLGTPERRGYQDNLQYAGPLRRGLHPAHLHPRHPPDAGSSSRNHGELHEPDDVMPDRKPPKVPGRKAKLPARCSLNLSRHFPVWVKLWVTPPDPLFDPHYFEGKQNKNSRNPAISGVSWSCYPDLNYDRPALTTPKVSQTVPIFTISHHLTYQLTPTNHS